jgi:hypothetical protein
MNKQHWEWEDGYQPQVPNMGNGGESGENALSGGTSQAGEPNRNSAGGVVWLTQSKRRQLSRELEAGLGQVEVDFAGFVTVNSRLRHERRRR